MKKVHFVVPGIPRGKERPRVTITKDGGKAYTPKQTREYEDEVTMMFRLYRGEKLEGPIRAEINAIFPIPEKETPERKAQMANGGVPYQKKADCDNIAKAILDALNGWAYKDDAQVTELSVSKFYGKEPKVTVTLTELGDIRPS